MSTSQNGFEEKKWRDCLWIASCATLPTVILGPFQNTPFIDDWTYAWSVEWLLQHGEVKILEWSSHLNVAQVLWGTLFCLPFGFSFIALRVSTWVLAVGCLCGLYLLLRELGRERRTALLGTVTLGVNPIFFILSFTFMTDVPFLAFMVWSSFAMVRAVSIKHDGWLLASVLFSCLAIGVRVVGVVLPVAIACALYFHSSMWGRQRGRIFLALIPVLFFGMLLWWSIGNLQYTVDVAHLPNAPVNRVQNLHVALSWLPWMLVRDTTFTVCTLGLFLLPLSVACIQTKLRKRVMVSLLVLGLFLLTAYLADLFAIPLSHDSIWSFYELGMTEPLVAGFQSPSIPLWWSGTAILVGWGSASIFFAALWRRSYSPGEAFLVWLTLGHFLLMAVLWLFFDRYALVLLPSTILLLVRNNVFSRPAVSIVCLALFGIVSFVGVYNHLQYNAALWQAVNNLHRRGVADADLDGGYIVNGWLQYAHPANAPRDGQGNIVVPGLTTKISPTQYKIANVHLPNWRLLETISYTRWLGRSGNIYILERESAPPLVSREESRKVWGRP